MNPNDILFKMLQGRYINQYHLAKLIGAGAFGGVYRAREVVRDQVITERALKLIISDGTARQLEELRKGSNLRHPHLMECYGCGEFNLEETEFLFLLMELAECSLQDRLKQQAKLTENETTEVVQHVAEALVFLHGQNLVHRDIKPDNILWLANQKRWKISDLGLITELSEHSVALSTRGLGTLIYMPPEAFRTDEDGKTQISMGWDTWAIGILVIRLLTGSYPYRFNSEPELMLAIAEYQVMIPRLPAPFDQIAKGCLAKDRKQRWTARQVLAALQPKSMQSLTIPGARPIEWVEIPAGSFEMGSNDYKTEQPIHMVSLQKFWIAKHLVTQGQYEAVMGTNPSYFKGQDLPVECVSWQDAIEFCQKLSQLTGQQVGLPSEAQWEYACRADARGKYCFGDEASKLGEYAWFGDNSGEKPLDTQTLWQENSAGYWDVVLGNKNQTHPVGQKKPNKWGLYDMHGNLWEWCVDHWHENYEGAPNDGSAWLTQNDDSLRVVRGGAWYYDPRNCRSAFRDWYYPYDRNLNLGFRVVCLPPRTL